MKKVILIIGSNGVGKSTTSKILLSLLPNSAYIDSDCCRAINPFRLTEETKIAVTQNIYCMFHNYLLCNDINTIIFPYGFHGERKEIWEQVVYKLKADNIMFDIYIILLKCSWEENIRRAKLDNRDSERIERGMKNTFSFYDTDQYITIDTTNLSAEETAEKILKMI